jgi:hypothetical protein
MSEESRDREGVRRDILTSSGNTQKFAELRP